MKLTRFSAISLLATSAIARTGKEPVGHTWHPAGPFDSRSPCPGLNALANHDWLPHDGKNIDLEAIQFAAGAVYNFDRDVLVSAVQSVYDFNLSTTGNSSTFDLGDLARHDTIEMDGSLSRNDIYFGDDLHFDPVVWAFTADKLGLYDLTDENGIYVTIESAAKARAARVAEAMRVNPTFNASQAQMIGSPGTTALYLRVLWDSSVNATHKDWVEAFFEEERLPYREGYEKPEEVTTGQSLGALVEAVINVVV
ncbi:Chloroperoxidase [Truncatella angustata]|uniref:Chloroperoxidase n=1 Tax=Truncatella angustata TaxID=152316 RepID=A0A9P8UMK5_9PEZI|nr:Chloroperoxidase [Truncatella angustata]KAH6654849.1 Chloroperoxidase [Truncatella angustata]KAH8197040.1 hypothetical protein TruAng_008791 [Truncatella angustata]